MNKFRQRSNNSKFLGIQARGFAATVAIAMVMAATAIFFAGPARADMAAMESSSTQFVEALATDALSALTDPEIPRDIRVKQFRVLFNERFAVTTIGRFVLGRHWKDATKEEQDEYLALFETLMVRTYVDRFEQYSGETLEMVRAVADKDTRATVQTKLIRPDISKPPVRMDWVIGAKGDEMKVIDVAVEGTSMAQTLRADFASIIRQKGTGLTGLIEALKDKLKSIEAS